MNPRIDIEWYRGAAKDSQPYCTALVDLHHYAAEEGNLQAVEKTPPSTDAQVAIV